MTKKQQLQELVAQLADTQNGKTYHNLQYKGGWVVDYQAKVGAFGNPQWRARRLGITFEEAAYTLREELAYATALDNENWNEVTCIENRWRDEWLTLAEAEREHNLAAGHIRDWLRRATNRPELLSSGQLKQADQRTVLIKRGFVQMKWGEKATP